jgi:hypothetical protein
MSSGCTWFLPERIRVAVCLAEYLGKYSGKAEQIERRKL